MLTYIDGVSVRRRRRRRAGARGGELVGRFHAAVDGMTHAFVGMRVGVHDTPRHLARSKKRSPRRPPHRLIAASGRWRARSATAPPRCRPAARFPPRICHGDLKFNNICFAGQTPPDDARAVC
jgi:Ser/Thr protein kinase RdoA (MazF antagonist)